MLADLKENGPCFQGLATAACRLHSRPGWHFLKKGCLGPHQTGIQHSAHERR